MKAIFYCALFLLVACKKQTEEDPQPFEPVPQSSLIASSPSEISGIADSKANPGFVWAQEDGGNPAQLYLINHSGVVQKNIPLKGIANRDWEDMCLTHGQIYLADIGDNNAAQSSYFIYKFAEPLASADTIRQVETIRFQYADGPHDAEAFWVDASNGSIYIITKRDAVSRIYQVTSPFSASTNTAVLAGSLPYNGVVSAAVSEDGKEVIVKTYTALNYYQVPSGSTLVQTLTSGPYRSLPYQVEPQGEAVCFAQDNRGIYTLSEKGLSSEVRLYFYKRK